jgi:hypothetical protein
VIGGVVVVAAAAMLWRWRRRRRQKAVDPELATLRARVAELDVRAERMSVQAAFERGVAAGMSFYVPSVVLVRIGRVRLDPRPPVSPRRSAGRKRRKRRKKRKERRRRSERSGWRRIRQQQLEFRIFKYSRLRDCTSPRSTACTSPWWP